MSTETSTIGTGRNPADNLARKGKKAQMFEQDVGRVIYFFVTETYIFFYQILDKVAAELAETEKQKAVERDQRMFETTNMAVHKEMDHYQNTIGRRVMKTQDGAPVSLNEKDEQLVVEHGTWRRLQRATDDELAARVPKGDYTK